MDRRAVAADLARVPLLRRCAAVLRVIRHEPGLSPDERVALLLLAVDGGRAEEG